MAVPVGPAQPISHSDKAAFGSQHQKTRSPSTMGGGGSNASPVPYASAINGGVLGSPYSEQISYTGGTGSSTLAVTLGALPTGASMSSGGAISATSLTVAGTFTFTVTATDSIGVTGSQSFTIVVAAATTGGTTSSGYIFLG